jgi:uncharacterized protein
MTAIGVAPTSQGNALVLVDPAHRVALPIMIGGTEGLSIVLRLQKKHFSRPLTQDLLDELVRRLGGHIVSVRIDSIQHDVFHATLVMWARGHSFEVDARASDGVALAIGDDVPIYVAEPVLAQAGIGLGGLDVKPPAALHPSVPQI